VFALCEDKTKMPILIRVGSLNKKALKIKN